MTEKPPEPRVEILLKSEQPGNARPASAARAVPGRRRWFAYVMLALVYALMLTVFNESFAPRVEWVDSAGRTMLEDRPVFWPLILFAVIGRLAVGHAVWFPDFFDPSRGFFPLKETPQLRRKRTIFRVLYAVGIGLGAWTLVNNLALADVYGIFRAVALVIAIVLVVSLVARVAVLSLLSRLSSQVRRP